VLPGPDLLVVLLFVEVLLFTPPDCVLLEPILLEVLPAALEVLVEAGLFAEPPDIAPAGGKLGKPLGPRSSLPPFMRLSAAISSRFR
jgi:hypothetical protein